LQEVQFPAACALYRRDSDVDANSQYRQFHRHSDGNRRTHQQDGAYACALAEFITPFNQALTDTSTALLDLSTTTELAMLEQIVTNQAMVIAFSNDFKSIMLISLVGLPQLILICTEGRRT
jgi:hypothetical protein